MADNQNDSPMPLKSSGGPSERAVKPSGDPEIADTKTAGGIWADEKAKANAKHDRAASSTKGVSLDALAVGGGQQSTPYQLETQADAIARQTKRGDV